MRTWIDYILSHPAACDDFIAWTKEANDALIPKLADAVLSNKMEQARGIAHEMTVYETLGRKMKAEMRERIARIKHDNERSQA